MIEQALDEYDVAKQKIAQLSVKAGMIGVIQRLPVKLGQSLAPGTELALVGSLSPLVAEVKVPQLQAHLVLAGMNAEIDSIHGQVAGQVVRVDPVVVDGAVQIDIQLGNEVNGSLKPMQLVDATIFASTQKGIKYIKTPAGISENMKVTLFKVTGDQKASRVEVKFGKVSGQLIQVLSGLDVGDEIIVSKVDVNREVKQIKLRG